MKVIRAPTPNKVETPIGQKKFFNNLVMYYSQDLDKKEDNDIAKERFEKSGDVSFSFSRYSDIFRLLSEAQ